MKELKGYSSSYKPLEILYIANGNGLNPNLGGSFVRTVEIAKRLSVKESVNFITTIGGFQAARREGVNANFRVLPASFLKKVETHAFDRILSYVICTFWFILVVHKIARCDIVYTDSDSFCDVIPAVLYKKIAKSKWLPMSHHRIRLEVRSPSAFMATLLEYANQSFSFTMFKRYADRVLIYKTPAGDEIKETLIRLGLSKDKIVPVCNGVDIKMISSIKVREKVYEACLVGGLRPGKGLYEVIPIWKEVVRSKPDAKLVVVGEMLSHYRSYLKAQADKQKIEANLELLGGCSHRAALEIIKKSKVLISPSTVEGWGIAIYEALASGVPVIAYALSSFIDIPSDTFIRVKKGDSPSFAKAVLECLSIDNLRTRLIQNGMSFVKEYDWNLIAEKELSLMQKLMNSNG